MDQTDKKLLSRAILKMISGVVIVGLLIFLPAGSLGYRQGWLLMAILFIPMFIAGLIIFKKSPQRLEKRLNVREEQPEQRMVIIQSAVVFIASLVTAGLNYRFGWIRLPDWIVYVSTVVFIAGYILYAEVLRENAFLSRVVEIQNDQKVIDTGLYGIVRHPMYTATLLLFLSMPLILGSPVSFVIMLLYIPIIRKRILNEEKVLSEGLEGYREYTQRVKHRLLPFIW